MVALNKKFHYYGAHGINSCTTTKCGCRSGEFAQPKKHLDQRCSDNSVSSVAGNYSNGGITGDIPDGTTDYVWTGNQAMEERNPFSGSGSTDTRARQRLWGTYIDELIQLTTLTTLGAQNVPAGTYHLLQDLLFRAVVLTNSSGAIVEAYDIDAYGIPTNGMISNLLRRMDLPAYERALSCWIHSCRVALEPCGEIEAISIDGKTLRGSQGHEVPGVHLLSAFMAGVGLVLKQVSAGANKEDGGEITAASEVLMGLVLKGTGRIHADIGAVQQLLPAAAASALPSGRFGLVPT